MFKFYPPSNVQVSIFKRKKTGTINKIQNAIAALSDCAVKCLNCASEDLNENDIKLLTDCIKLNQECAVTCFFAMQAIVGDSRFTMQIVELCAEVCNACADECEKHLHMEHCKVCAEACRTCALACFSIA